jgi:hypothetical protein
MWAEFLWLKVGPVTDCCEHLSEPSISVKGGKCLGWPSDF